VVGCGYWGKNLVRNFHDFGAVHTIGDMDRRCLDGLGQLYPDVEIEAEYDGLLQNKDIQAVVIATPATMHYSMAKQAVLAGKDVFVEKPMSLKLEEGEELAELADKQERILMVGHLMEYHPAMVKLRDMVRSGELGRIEYIYSSRLNLGRFRTEENVLWSLSTHDISAILMLLDEVPSQLSTHGGRYLNRDIADLAVINMSFGNMTEAHVFISWLHPYKEQKLVVIGSEKMAVFDNATSSDKLTVYEQCIEWQGDVPVPGGKIARPVEYDTEEPLKLECRHFLEAVQTRSAPRTGGKKALDVLRVLDACQRSLENGGAIVPVNSGRIFIHPTSIIDQPVTIGSGTSIWHFSHVMSGAVIGDNCNIGQNVFVADNVRIGNNVKIQNNVSVFKGVVLEDNVFCGPSCVFTNIKVPRSSRSQKGKYVTTLVKSGATVGANATVICGVTIGKHALVGAGAVVTRDVPDHAMVLGNPAEIKGWVCECGTRLDMETGSVKCSCCGNEYVGQEFDGKYRIEKVILVNPGY
jgi:UDP-2-acetamido-3-amino-2,3-dideoxy-glucuronate N-acetyltransferase